MDTTVPYPSGVNSLADRLVAEHGGEARITALPGHDRWEVAAVKDRGEDGLLCLASEIVHGDGTDALLAPGTRIKHRRYPDLTGNVQFIERQADGTLSGIPYNVRWDDDGRACDLLGWFYIYATDHGIEEDNGVR